MSRVRGWTVAVLVLSLLELLALVAVLQLEQRVAADFEQFLDDPYSDGSALFATAATADKLGLLVAGVSLACLIAVIGWLHACVKAVGALNLGPLRHSSGWAIGAWFVPVLNLLRVPQIVADVYRAGRRQVAPAGVVVGGWWGLTLIDAVIGRGASIQKVPATAEQFRQMLQLNWAAEILHILSALATLGLVLLLTSGLSRAAAAMASGEWAAPLPQLPLFPPPNPAFGSPQPSQFGPAPTPQFGAPLPTAPYAPQAFASPTPPTGPDVTRRSYLPE